MPKELGDIDPAMMTVPEAAKYLGVGRKVVYQLIEYGRLRAIRDRSVVMVEKTSLEEFRSSGQLT
jgi:excisionase family DNA binding protein